MGNCTSGPPQSPRAAGIAAKKDLSVSSSKSSARKYAHIADQYSNLEQVQAALREAGLESSNLIVGIDFTKSNEWTGIHSFNGRSLHAIGAEPNPYQQAIAIIGQTLSPFDEDNLIPCFGFGDTTTHDKQVFSFFEDQRPCSGFEEVLTRYRAIVPHLRLSGPTSFAPIIEAALQIVIKSGCQYHVLVIIADGQVSTNENGEEQSQQEKATIDAIVAASEYPLSIVLVGVGDGPWEKMKEFDDNIPARQFDNFQFVNFTSIMRKEMSVPQKEAVFAVSALMEIPAQFKATLELRLLGRQQQPRRSNPPLTPPPKVSEADTAAGGWYGTAAYLQ